MDVFVRGRDLNFDYDLHSLVSSFSGDPEVNIIKEGAESGSYVNQNGSESGSYVNQNCSGSVSLNVCFGEDSAEVSIGDDSVSVPTDTSDRRSTKNALKRAVYGLLSRHYGRKLPWGTLSGVRPTKLPMKLLGEGLDEREVAGRLQESYLISDEKTRLVIGVAKKEREILRPIWGTKGYSLYIGIPFCPSRCAYCSFTSYPIEGYAKRVDDYIGALIKELQAINTFMAGHVLQTVYIGGGTPTSLSADQLDRLMTAVDTVFDRGELLEYTVEAGRPDSITGEKLSVIKSHGAGRISINPQTMNQPTLDLIGRRHTVEQVSKSFYLARDIGFTDINMDLILGLPGEGIGELRSTLDKVRDMKPDNLTFHSLAVKRAGIIRQVMRDGAQDENEARLLASEITSAHIDLAADTAKSLGMEAYYLYRQQSMTGNFENTGYATPGKEGIYNVVMMEEQTPVMAAGAGAVSKFLVPGKTKEKRPHLKDIERVENVKNVDEYISRIDEMIERKARKVEEIYGT